MNLTSTKVLIVLSMITAFSVVHADMGPALRNTIPCGPSQSISGSLTPAGCGLKTDHQLFQDKKKGRLQDIRKNRMTASGNLREFHMTQSGILREERRSHTGSNEALKDAIEHQNDLRKGMSGKTLEERLAGRNELEDAQRAKLIAKFQTNTGILAKRLEVYEKNKTMRDQNAASLLANLLERSEIRLSDVNIFISRVQEKLPAMSQEVKEKLTKKISERILKIQSAKGITQAVKDEIIKKLNDLSLEITSSQTK